MPKEVNLQNIETLEKAILLCEVIVYEWLLRHENLISELNANMYVSRGPVDLDKLPALRVCVWKHLVILEIEKLLREANSFPISVDQLGSSVATCIRTVFA